MARFFFPASFQDLTALAIHTLFEDSYAIEFIRLLTKSLLEAWQCLCQGVEANVFPVLLYTDLKVLMMRHSYLRVIFR